MYKIDPNIIKHEQPCFSWSSALCLFAER